MVIKGKIYYTPREIKEFTLLISRNDPTKRVNNYQSVLRIIREGKLKPRNIGKGKTPYWVVSAEEIGRYNACG